MDFQDLQVGDVVTITATIANTLDRDDEYYVEFDGGRRSTYVHYTAITAVTDKPLKAGDRVNVHGCTTNPGTIRAVDGEDAWVRWDQGGSDSYLLSELVRVDA